MTFERGYRRDARIEREQDDGDGCVGRVGSQPYLGTTAPLRRKLGNLLGRDDAAFDEAVGDDGHRRSRQPGGRAQLRSREPSPAPKRQQDAELVLTAHVIRANDGIHSQTLPPSLHCKIIDASQCLRVNSKTILTQL